MTDRQARRFARNAARNPQLWISAQPSGFPAAAHPGVPGSTLARRSGGFRFRRHLVPFAWLAILLFAGLGTRAAGIGAGILAGFILAGLVVFLSWHAKPFARKMYRAAAAETLILVPLLCAYGWTRPWPAVLAVPWAVTTLCWVVHYAWRPADSPEPELDEIAQWAQTLGAKGKLAGTRLVNPEHPAPDAIQFTLRLIPGQHDTSDVFGMSGKIASLYGKSRTEAFPERRQDGREDMMLLTLLTRNTLTEPRQWDGKGIDPETGLAVIGRFPDGKPLHFRYFTRMNGCRQSIMAGVTGSGKSSGLSLIALAALASDVPVIPIIMDPQDGQSLPDWQGIDGVPMASTPEQCMRFLRAISAGVRARSAHLAQREWTDAEGVVHPGMGFFDTEMTGMPVILPILDEAHLVLNEYGDDARDLLAVQTKLNRKTGTHLVLAAHNLLLEELKSTTMFSNLRSGNAIALRTGERMSGGKLGLSADPHELPMYFPDGTPTTGLGYAVGPDNRPDSPVRLDDPGNIRKLALAMRVPEMDEVFGTAFRRSLEEQEAAAKPAGKPALKVVEAEPEEDAPVGRAAVDAVLAVLPGDGSELGRGEILKRAGKLVKAEWGRAQPFSVRSMQDALEALTASERIRKVKHGVYRRGAASTAASETGG